MKHFLARVYGALLYLRNAVYDKSLTRIHRVSVPVLSVGNITVGGTGKTPTVERLLEHFLKQHLKPAVVTRGYARDSRGTVVVSNGDGNIISVEMGGDEAVQIARKFPAAVVVADERRSRGCLRAVRDFGVDCIILDDAFQHRAMHRDIDIVVLDAMEGIHGQRLLPAGRLREPLYNLRRAHIILLNRCEPELQQEKIIAELHAYASAPLFRTRFLPRCLRKLHDNAEYPRDHLAGRALISFCGIGAPASFQRTVSMLGVNSLAHTDFPDHHRFTTSELASLQRQAMNAGTDIVLTTEKDASRLLQRTHVLDDLEVYYPEMRLEFLGAEEEETRFFALLESGHR